MSRRVKIVREIVNDDDIDWVEVKDDYTQNKPAAKDEPEPEVKKEKPKKPIFKLSRA